MCTDPITKNVATLQTCRHVCSKKIRAPKQMVHGERKWRHGEDEEGKREDAIGKALISHTAAYRQTLQWKVRELVMDLYKTQTTCYTLIFHYKKLQLHTTRDGQFRKILGGRMNFFNAWSTRAPQPNRLGEHFFLHRTRDSVPGNIIIERFNSREAMFFYRPMREYITIEKYFMIRYGRKLTAVNRPVIRIIPQNILEEEEVTVENLYPMEVISIE
ncbi:hypothetical protein CRE_29089 [Caenorhabditis remanei]|uniref:PAZ domain-containing protein n=1 Tax=Caenorhabditis remanei TaxID=31234 RepID=E3MWC2_CAERE|nr:hypothetical protein CRE_29089 [Caenorhabditis remanei]